MPAFEHAVELMKQYPNLLNVGIHFVTSVEYSVLKGHKTLTDEHGHFYHDETKIASASYQEVYDEYEAQLQKFLDTGFTPTHIDWHWCHTPVQLKASMALAKKYNLPMRAHTKEIETKFLENGNRFIPNHYNAYYNHDQKHPITTPETLISILQNGLDQGLETMTLMCHPAYVDATLMHLSSYHVIRATELETLLSPVLKEFIDSHDIEIISYKDI